MSHKLLKQKRMDIYDLLDYESVLIVDAMISQTKLTRLNYIHEQGIAMLNKKYTTEIEQELLESYINLIDTTYYLCLMKLQKPINTVCLN